MELACERLVRDLIAGGHEVRWLAQDEGLYPDLPEGTCVPFAGSDAIYTLAGVPMPIPYPTAIGKLRRSFDWADLVVIVEANFLISALAHALARMMGKRIVLVQHVGQASTVSRLARWIMRVGEAAVARSMIRNADAVIYVSRNVAAHFAGLRTGRLTQTISHAIDTDLFRPPASEAERQQARASLGLRGDTKIACYVGRRTLSKGIMVIKHMAQMREDWTFAIAGVGPVDPDAWNLPNVIALGQLDQIEVAQLYGVSEAMVLPSQSESFSLVVREALACECSVICSTQILETDPRISDFLTTRDVDLANPEHTARRFAAALDEGAAMDGRASRDYVIEECSARRVQARYLDVVERVAAYPREALS